MKDREGRQLSGGLARLGIITVMAIVAGIAGLVYGAHRGGGIGIALLVLAVITLAALIWMWSAIAVTQRKRRNLQPPE